MDKKGEVHQVHYKACTFVERKQKLLAPKLDSLLQHQSCKVKVLMSSVDDGIFYFNKNSVHA
jgi:hypothetical protein